MPAMNAFYAQSGGVTAVINATACGVIETARKHKNKIANVYAGNNGIIGALTEDMINTNRESARTIAALKHMPGGAFGSARYKLKGIEENRAEYERLIQVFKEHDIGYFFYNGGNDSMDTAHKVSLISKKLGHPVIALGVPKTVDNDLPVTDNCPGFGSVAKYVAVSTREAAMDVASMAKTSTKVFILEVMGRHAGWIAAAGGLAGDKPQDAPHIILFPEVPFNKRAFLKRVKDCVHEYDYCVIVVSEGARYKNGKFLAEAGTRDAFGHAQLGGVAPVVAQIVRDNLGFKYHYAIADYLQRSARHIASAVDVEQAYAVGREAVRYALAGKTAVMPVIKRVSDSPYRWKITDAPLARIANKEKMLPARYITKDGFGITAAGRRYLEPLIYGEDYPPYINGLPKYPTLKNVAVKPKLGTKFVV
ncbi:MAG: 6-phosphofructokinase [Gammaproteobacteria bacterium]|nr:6-phosphofructokinase [Gammaproteobacteria bacterium]